MHSTHQCFPHSSGTLLYCMHINLSCWAVYSKSKETALLPNYVMCCIVIIDALACYYYWITLLCQLKLILVVHPITHSTWFPLLSLKQTVAMSRDRLTGTVVTQIAVAGWFFTVELVPLATLVGFMAELAFCVHVSSRWIDWPILLAPVFFALWNISTCKAAGDGSTVTGVCPFVHWISSLWVSTEAYITRWHSDIPLLQYSSLSIKLLSASVF
jgi:hypothetical protein